MNPSLFLAFLSYSLSCDSWSIIWCSHQWWLTPRHHAIGQENTLYCLALLILGGLKGFLMAASPLHLNCVHISCGICATLFLHGQWSSTTNPGDPLLHRATMTLAPWLRNCRQVEVTSNSSCEGHRWRLSKQFGRILSRIVCQPMQRTRIWVERFLMQLALHVVSTVHGRSLISADSSSLQLYAMSLCCSWLSIAEPFLFRCTSVWEVQENQLNCVFTSWCVVLITLFDVIALWTTQSGWSVQLELES